MRLKFSLFKLYALVAAVMCAIGASAAEAYTCYTSSDSTLTFYYDNLRSSRPGTTYDLNEGSSQPEWVIDSTNTSVTQVVFDPSFADARPTTTFRWFYFMSNLQSITGMEYLNTEEVTNMRSMFHRCRSLTSLDLSNFNTANVTDMGFMFYNCSGLSSLDLSSFNTANVTNMHDMFSECEELLSLDLSSFNTANVTDMGFMFNYCHELSSLDLSSFNTANVTNMNAMFRRCNDLLSLDLSSFNTANVTDMGFMFAECFKLATIYVGSHWSTSAVTTSTSMFFYCFCLVGGQGTSYNSSYINAEYAHIDGGPSNPGYFTEKAPEAYACYTSADSMLTFYFDNLRSTRTGTTYDLNEGDHTPAWNSVGTNVTKVVFDSSFAGARPTTTYGWFYNMENLQSIIGIEYLNTVNVTNMSLMFSFCSALTSLDLSSFNTANVTDMSWMFWQCSGLTSIVFSDPSDDEVSFITPNVTDMRYMFSGCRALTSLNLVYFNTSNVTNMTKMFADCSSLKKLSLHNFNTANVTEMNSMFQGCYGLLSLDLSSFNTAKVCSMGGMFERCSNLIYLDLSSFNTNRVTSMYNMFDGCRDLTTICVGIGWSTAAVSSSSMFNGCTSLVGGMGTTYDESHIDKAYAHIDGGPSDPGYLSEKMDAYAVYTSGNTTLTFYYDNLRSTRTGTIYDLNTSPLATSTLPGWYNDGTRTSVTQVMFDPSFDNAYPITTYSCFRGMTNLVSITGMNYLHTDITGNMSYMFGQCEKLTSIDLSHFSTVSASDMSSMFYYCRALTSLDLSSFNTANALTMGYMFSECRALTSLDLSNFNTANVWSMRNMFNNCTNLITIYAGNGWNTDNVTSSTSMFTGSTKLVGGLGTTYNSSHTDKAYAHIDGGTANPGYLTAVLAPYAVYTPDNTTLTFFYDTLGYFRPGIKYVLNEGHNTPGWIYLCENYVSPVTHVVFNSSFADARPTITYGWFANMENLQSITGMEYLNTSEVTDMRSMFHQCSSLTSLDVSGFNTAKVTNMEFMFYYCSGLKALDLSSFNTANVTDMGHMFESCSDLTTIYAGSGWSTASVSSSGSMFCGCTSLVGGMGTTYDANYDDKTYAHIDGGPDNPGYFSEKAPEAYACYTSSNTTLTFYYDTQRSSRTGTTYDLNTGNNQPDWVNDGTNSSVTHVAFDPSFADARPTTTRNWFFCMKNLQSISNIEYLNTSEVTSLAAMFIECSSLTSLDLNNFNTANVTDMFNMFYGCTSLRSIDVGNFNTAQVTDLRGMFFNCTSLTTLDLSSFNTAMTSNMTNMFNGCSNLTTIYVGNGWNTDGVNFSQKMFTGCTSLVGGQGTTYDANHIDKTYAHIDGGPSNPGYFSEKDPEAYACYTPDNTTLTFYYDGQRSSRTGTTYDLNTATSQPEWVIDGSNSSVTRVQFDPAFANARPISTRCWFYLMENLESITGMEYLNTSAVTNMTNMFCSCSSLTELDVSHFNTESVVQMEYTFAGCSGLTSLDLSSFNTEHVTDMQGMFYFDNNLVTIYVGSSWTTAPVLYSSSMFYSCRKLVGGQGTTYNSSNPQDKTYAHIDGGPSNPGYFTAAFIRGDVNGDTHVSIADVTALIDYLLSHDASSINVDAADCNQDTNVSISDVTALIDYLLSGHW